MEIQGKIKVIGDTQTFGSNNFQKRDLVLTTEEQYPQHLQIEFVKDKTALLDQFRLGEPVTVGINLRGREWVNPEGESKYFNSIQGWKIQSNGAAKAPVNNGGGQAQGSPVPDDDDDLPFSPVI